MNHALIVRVASVNDMHGKNGTKSVMDVVEPVVLRGAQWQTRGPTKIFNLGERHSSRF